MELHPEDVVTFIAKVTNKSTGQVPFGSVQFVVDGEPVLGPLPLLREAPPDEVNQVGLEDAVGLPQLGVEHTIDSCPHGRIVQLLRPVRANVLSVELLHGWG